MKIMIRRRLMKCLQYVSPLRRDRRGAAAVEFALLLPLMLLTYIGATDVTRGVLASRNVDLLSRTISDLVAQKSTAAPIQGTDIALVFTAAAAIMQPFDTTPLSLTVSAIDISADGSKNCCQAVVRWSFSQSVTPGSTQRACKTLVVQAAPSVPPTLLNMPAAIGQANAAAGFGYSSGSVSYIIVTDVTYTYHPFFPQAVAWFAGGMQKTTYMVPRSVSNPITLATPVTTSTSTVTGTTQAGTVCF